MRLADLIVLNVRPVIAMQHGDARPLRQQRPAANFGVQIGELILRYERAVQPDRGDTFLGALDFVACRLADRLLKRTIVRGVGPKRVSVCQTERDRPACSSMAVIALLPRARAGPSGKPRSSRDHPAPLADGAT